MFRTLYGRLAAVLLGLFVLLGAVFVVLALYATRVNLEETDQRLNRDLARHIVSDTDLIRDGRIRREAAREIFRLLMVVHPAIEVYLLGPDGRILAYSAPPGKIVRDRVSLSPVRRFLEGPAMFPVRGDDPRDPHREKVFSAAPIPASGTVQGYLYVILGGEEADTVSQRFQGSYILQLSVVAGALSLLFSLAAGLLLFYRLTVRHRRLAAAVEEFVRSGFTRPADAGSGADASSGDEIDRLAHAFRRMEEKIVRQIREVRDADVRRRELIAHVSHDLRTPLTSLQGYLETLTMKDDLPEPERKEYLAVALRHCRRMSELIFDLFELARLDSPDLTLRSETFSLGDLAQDVVVKFRLEARKKGIRLNLDLQDGLPLVRGDVGLLDRVLCNLVGNAVRHTPEGGEITVGASAPGGRVRMRVSDSGPGIPPDRLTTVADRGPAEGAGTPADAGSGLGLSIAGKILALHGSPMRVESAPDAGTTISFELPAAP